MTMLVERLAGTTVGVGVDARRASILKHLRWKYGTRRGTVRGRPDYGLPDISEMVHGFPEAVAELRDALMHTTTMYEPRLTAVHITHVPGVLTDLAVHFEIRAEMKVSGMASPVRFETALSATRGPTVT